MSEKLTIMSLDRLRRLNEHVGLARHAQEYRIRRRRLERLRLQTRPDLRRKLPRRELHSSCSLTRLASGCARGVLKMVKLVYINT